MACLLKLIRSLGIEGTVLDNQSGVFDNVQEFINEATMALRLDDIDYFLAVARHRQVRRAALDLGLSQPAVTKGIQRLEQELGFPLFTRSRRGMELTAVAEQFHERVRTLRNSLGEA